MFVNKTGKHHLDYGRNCQDYGMATSKRKMVCDGCSEGAHTEVGTKAFVHLINNGYGLEEAFEKLVELFGQTAKDVRNYLCFTVIQVEETEEEYHVSFCGDGYVVLEDISGEITFLELNDGAYPRYYVYNYVDRDSLKCYRDGVSMEKLSFSKGCYRKVGAATDGLRFALREEKIREELIAALRSDREIQVKRLVNKYQALLKDDLTIAW